MKNIAIALVILLQIFFVGNSFGQAVEEDVEIGDQMWMPRNLDVKKYNDGTPIKYAENDLEWKVATSKGIGCWCYCKNKNIDFLIKKGKDTTGMKKFGLLYNWYAVNNVANGGICPDGYRIPTRADWKALENVLGEKEAAAKCKSLDYWNVVKNSSNEIHFNALPAGLREASGRYNMEGRSCGFWTNEQTSNNEYAYVIMFETDLKNLLVNYKSQQMGFSVRCIRE